MRYALAALFAASAAAAAPPPTEAAAEPALRPSHALLLMDYQVLKVVGDQPIDLMGLHVLQQVAPGLHVGAGLYAPLIKGQYGGFTAYDVAAHAQVPLTSRFFAAAGLALGGGAGGRSVENARALSGSGGYYKIYAGLGVDFGAFEAGLNVSRVKFSRSAIDSTQANAFLAIPFSTLTGPFSRHGQRLSAAESDEAAAAASERMLTVVFDNFRQQHPQGTYKGGFNIADLQYTQFFSRDAYWFAALGVGYRGLPLYNQVMGGVGQRFAWLPGLSLLAQLGVGSGGYAPERIDTDAGLVIYPKLALEYALNKDLGLALSSGFLVAPKGSSKNLSVGLALNRHLRVRDGSGGGSSASYQAYRVSLFQQTDAAVRFRGEARGQLQMIGVQVDAIAGERWYIPLQAAVATSTYLGYPGYGELLGGLGVQTLAAAGEPWQAFGQVMAGTNVHGLAVKAEAGLRYALSERLALHATVGLIEARSAAHNRFRANSIGLGLDYRFSLPVW